MRGERINRISGWVVTGLGLVALLAVISGYFQPRQTDEGAAAHIFQLSIVLTVPTLLLFFITADWKQPVRNLRALMVPGVALVVAFGALYYLEH